MASTINGRKGENKTPTIRHATVKFQNAGRKKKILMVFKRRKKDQLQRIQKKKKKVIRLLNSSPEN